MSHGSDRPQNTVRDDDIRGKDIERRSFLRGFGLLAGSGSVAPFVAGCGSSSDSCDTDLGDPVTFDNDPTDPVSADQDVGDPCDSD